jgi:predicted DNA-binding transcriptional regulator YafY
MIYNIRREAYMADERNAVAERLLRLTRIIRYFFEKEDVYTSNIAAEFATTTRTIQRDLLALRKAGFPIHEKKKGLHYMDKSIISNLRHYEDSELALIVALRDMVTQLGRPFGDNAEAIFNRLSDYTDSRPVFVKLDEPTRFSGKTVDKVVRGINEKRRMMFKYMGGKKKEHPVNAEPYRIVYFGGFWYLVAKDMTDGTTKKYALDRIREITLTKIRFKKVPDNIDDMLKNSVNIWFTTNRNIKVIIDIDPLWADYFKRRGNILPFQKIIEERADGSLGVSFMACNQEEISMCIKPWLPHVRIVEPEDIKDDIVKEMKTWVKWQEGESGERG